MENLTGKQLGPYQVIAPVGEGGMAAVYKSYQPATDRYVALKILPRYFASDPQFTSRFRQEAKVLAKLQHPHILPVFDFGEADGYTYIVMPFIESGTLVNLMRGEPLPLVQIRRIISQVGDALDYAHQRGLIHRDVKPSNILIDERENCSLMDFGLSKIMEGSTHLTASGAIMGTPAYMSPEQALGEKLDARTDIYSLGIILYEMATGRVPYKAETPMAVMVKHINDPLPLPRVLNESLAEAVERVILKSLAKKPEDRFSTAGEMVKTLQAVIPENPPAAPALNLDRLTASSAKAAPALPSLKRPVWMAASGCAAAAILGIMAGTQIPPLGVAIGAALCGLSVGFAWRRLEPSASRKQIVSLMSIWILTLSVSLLFGPLYFLMGGVNGWLSGLVLRKTRPAITRKQLAFIALGWVVSWLVGGILFAIATSIPDKILSLMLATLAIMLGGAIGSRVMFAQYQRAPSNAPAQ